jgi:hypothetical protein
MLEKHNTVVKDLMKCIRHAITKTKKKKIQKNNDEKTRRPYHVFMTEKLPLIKKARIAKGIDTKSKKPLEICRALWKALKDDSSINVEEWIETHACVRDDAAANANHADANTNDANTNDDADNDPSSVLLRSLLDDDDMDDNDHYN